MKKIIALILSLVLVLSFAACGSDKKTDDADTNTGSTTVMDEISVSDIVAQTASGSDIEFYSFMTETIDSEMAAYFIGTDVIDTPFVEAVAHVPMMNTNPFALIVFRTADEATAATLAEELENETNLGKLVCVQAETMETVVSGKTVLFVMGSQVEVDAILTAYNAI